MKIDEVKLPPILHRAAYEYADHNGNVHTIHILLRDNDMVQVFAKNSNGMDSSLSNYLPQPWPNGVKNSYAASDYLKSALQLATMGGGNVQEKLQKLTQKQWNKADH